MSDRWQAHIPEELIEELCDADEWVTFTDAWRELEESEQLDIARNWLRKALGLEQWR